MAVKPKKQNVKKINKMISAIQCEDMFMQKRGVLTIVMALGVTKMTHKIFLS